MRIVEFFSGISCQYRGFVEANCFDSVEQVATSDIAIDSIVANAAINHNLMLYLDKFKGISLNEMREYLVERNIGYDFNKGVPYNWDRANDEYVNKVYTACRLTNNLGDISKIESSDIPLADLWFLSFPCQAISQAGRMLGFKADAETNSSLLWQNIRLLRDVYWSAKSPKYIMVENVKNLVSKTFIDDWNNVLEIFDNLGYNCQWKVIDAKDCGVPQSRPRVFMVGIRKDVDLGRFEWPDAIDSNICIADVLEDTVADRYLLSEKIVNRFHLTDPTYSKNVIGDTMPDCRTIGQRDTVYNINGIMGACMASDYKQPKQILVPKDGREYKTPFNMDDYILRKMTPREIGILQGFTYVDTDKMVAAGISDTKIYMAYGNGICVPCVSLIAKQLYKAQKEDIIKDAV